MTSIKGYLLCEDFQRFREYNRPYLAKKFLDNWVTRTLQTDLEPMKKDAKMLDRHKPLILNWFQTKGELFSGALEGMNFKAKLTMRKAKSLWKFSKQKNAADFTAEFQVHGACGAMKIINFSQGIFMHHPVSRRF